MEATLPKMLIHFPKYNTILAGTIDDVTLCSSMNRAPHEEKRITPRIMRGVRGEDGKTVMNSRIIKWGLKKPALGIS